MVIGQPLEPEVLLGCDGAGRDCDEACLFSNTFAFGSMCTMFCLGDSDCPAATRCVAAVGFTQSVCMVSCRSDNECAEFSRGYSCVDATSPRGGTNPVCFDARLFPLSGGGGGNLDGAVPADFKPSFDGLGDGT